MSLIDGSLSMRHGNIYNYISILTYIAQSLKLKWLDEILLEIRRQLHKRRMVEATHLSNRLCGST